MSHVLPLRDVSSSIYSMSKIQSDSFQRLSTFSCTPCSYSLQLLSRTKCQYLVLSPLRQTSRCPPNDRLPVDEEPIIPNLKSGTGSEHHTRKPSQHESTSIDLIMQVAYFGTGANSSMANVADQRPVGSLVVNTSLGLAILNGKSCARALRSAK